MLLAILLIGTAIYLYVKYVRQTEYTNTIGWDQAFKAAFLGAKYPKPSMVAVAGVNYPAS